MGNIIGGQARSGAEVKRAATSLIKKGKATEV